MLKKVICVAVVAAVTISVYCCCVVAGKSDERNEIV